MQDKEAISHFFLFSPAPAAADLRPLSRHLMCVKGTLRDRRETSNCFHFIADNYLHVERMLKEEKAGEQPHYI